MKTFLEVKLICQLWCQVCMIAVELLVESDSHQWDSGDFELGLLEVVLFPVVASSCQMRQLESRLAGVLWVVSLWGHWNMHCQRQYAAKLTITAHWSTQLVHPQSSTVDKMPVSVVNEGLFRQNLHFNSEFSTGYYLNLRRLGCFVLQLQHSIIF